MPSNNAATGAFWPDRRYVSPALQMPWLATVFLPALFALATWPGFLSPLDDRLRHLSIPVVAVELAVIITAMRHGLDLAEWFNRLRKWMRLALSILIAIAFGTAIFVAVDRSEALVRTCSSLIHLLFFVSCLHLFRSNWKDLRDTTWAALFLGTLSYLAVMTVFVATIGRSASFNWEQFNLAVTNIRQTGFYSMVGACIALGLAVNSKSRVRISLWICGGAMLLAISFWGGTRSSIVAFLAAMAFAFCAAPEWRTKTLLLSAVAMTALAMPMSIVHDPQQPFMGLARLFDASDPANGDVTTGRWATWKLTASMIAERPLFGAGESQFRLLFTPWHAKYNHPHNWPLQIGFQWGLLGALCYFSLAAAAGWQFLRKSIALGSEALPAVLVATGVLAFSLVEGAMYHPYPISVLALAIAWVMANGTSDRGDETSSAACPVAAR